MFIRLTVTAPANHAGATFIDKSTDALFVFVGSGVKLELLKRAAYPGTYAYLKNGELFFGYGQQAANQVTEQEYFRGHIDRNGAVRIERDIFCTLPVFFVAGKQTLAISDDYETVLKVAESKTINEAALSSLLFTPTINDQTLHEAVNLLGERSELQWSAAKLTVSKWSADPHEITSTNPQDFKAHLEKALQATWDKTAGERVAFEVSAGIDSSTMPTYIARTHQPAMTLATMAFPDNFGTTQSQKIADIVEQTDAKLFGIHIDPAVHYPLARFFASGYKPFYQYQEIYSEALGDLATQVADAGFDVIFTGVGGDELFENRITEPRPLPAIPSYAAGAPESFLKAHLASKEVETLLPNSGYYAGQSRNKVYIDHGVWPVAPLLNLELYRYCQGLEIAFRANKNILRAYHQAIGSPPSVYSPVQNEHFGRFFEDSIRQNYARVLTELSKQSYLSRESLVDWDALTTAFNGAKWRENAHSQLFDIFRLASAEVILQS